MRRWLLLVLSVVVAIGGISELRRVASERASLLATERERAPTKRTQCAEV
jgi:hypothetical protein